ncbi:MAG: tetratricopeptide repeat protein [Spirochaetota bacterium]
MLFRKVFASLLVPCMLGLLIPLRPPPARGEGQPDLGFSYHLFRKGEHRAAVLELHRFLYYRSGHRAEPWARYLLALSRANLGDYARAEAELRALAEDLEGCAEHAGLRGEVMVQAMNVQLRDGRFENLLLLGDALDADTAPLDHRLAGYAAALRLAALVSLHRWEEARAVLAGGYVLEEEARSRLEAELERLIARRPPSPLAAGVLSLVPGLGHLHAGRPVDGARSLAINAAFAGLAGTAFLHGAVPVAVLSAVAWLFLYLSNIYGGINAALQEDAGRVLEARGRMLRLLPVPPLDVITLREELAGL